MTDTQIQIGHWLMTTWLQRILEAPGRVERIPRELTPEEIEEFARRGYAVVVERLDDTVSVIERDDRKTRPGARVLTVIRDFARGSNTLRGEISRALRDESRLTRSYGDHVIVHAPDDDAASYAPPRQFNTQEEKKRQ